MAPLSELMLKSESLPVGLWSIGFCSVAQRMHGRRDGSKESFRVTEPLARIHYKDSAAGDRGTG